MPRTERDPLDPTTRVAYADWLPAFTRDYAYRASMPVDLVDADRILSRAAVFRCLAMPYTGHLPAATVADVLIAAYRYGLPAADRPTDVFVLDLVAGVVRGVDEGFEQPGRFACMYARSALPIDVVAHAYAQSN